MLKISIKGCSLDLTSKEGLLIAKEYQRVVIGGRGSWIEFKSIQIIPILEIEPEETWRLNSSVAYYLLQKVPGTSINVYHQLRTVKYADYRIGMDYISPWDLYTENKRIIEV